MKSKYAQCVGIYRRNKGNDFFYDTFSSLFIDGYMVLYIGLQTNHMC